MRFIGLLGFLLSAAVPVLAQPVPGYFLSPTATGVTTSQTVSAVDQAKWLGAPNDVWFGLGDQTVTFDLGGYRLLDGSGVDLVVYEADRDAIEFPSLAVWVSANGTAFHNISSTVATNPVRIIGDEAHSDANFRRGYDVGGALTALSATELRFIRLIGSAPGTNVAFGQSVGFDLDAVGLVHFSAPPPDVTAAIPEPASWAMLLAGFGLIGGTLRRRRMAAA